MKRGQKIRENRTKYNAERMKGEGKLVVALEKQMGSNSEKIY